MGLFSKLANGNARHYKVYRRCNSCSDTNVYVVTTKSGRDLLEMGKKEPEALMKEVYGDCCPRCTLNVDEIAAEDVRTAKKIYSSKEIN